MTVWVKKGLTCNVSEGDKCGGCWSEVHLEFALPLTKAPLNYIFSGNDTDEITFIGVLHAIRAVPPIVFQRKLNI